ncbi:hypothetical protein A1O3_04155 [Capronia epimyces CBS 606.96]|uniref:NmrA-like domain-containing protein n=1 Tax=Capronia epimyces CBS 606.96 TaxID=1182542 RepID=W9YD59_9EURO|nr:uncharacterized protein A1O3_04155 [Capronia epimyces CBS 606.96]EXJ87196.1 hypothetical protein A1O3_04155 [Capronia epimyces CBS 606.96]
MSGSQVLKKVLFIGAGGNIGGPIFRSLEKAGFDLTVLSRPDSKNTFGPNVKVVKKLYDDPSLSEAFEGQDAVVSFVSVAALLDQIKLIDVAAKAGVKRFIPSELGSNTLNPKAQELVFFYKQKQTVLEHLEATAKKNPGFSWTGLATGPVFDWGLQVGFLGFNLKTHTALIYDDGNVRISYTNLDTIGEAVGAILRKPAETANKYLSVSSFTLSLNDILASLEAATETKWTVNHASTADAEREGKEKLAKGDFTGVRTLLARLMYGGDTGANFEKEPTFANQLLELPQESLDATVKAIVAGQK